MGARLETLIAVAIAGTVAMAQPARLAEGPFVDTLVEAALEQTRHAVTYDGSYRAIGYPIGAVTANIGVCTVVIIRAYRLVGLDLRRLVHEDMRAAFSTYPNLWGLTRPDRNIDHRRVPNL